MRKPPVRTAGCGGTWAAPLSSVRWWRRASSVWVNLANQLLEPVRAVLLLERRVHRLAGHLLGRVNPVVHQVAYVDRHEHHRQKGQGRAVAAAHDCHQHRDDEGRHQRDARPPDEELVPHPRGCDPDPDGLRVGLLLRAELHEEEEDTDCEASDGAGHWHPRGDVQLVDQHGRDGKADRERQEHVAREEGLELSPPERRVAASVFEVAEHEPHPVDDDADAEGDLQRGRNRSGCAHGATSVDDKGRQLAPVVD